MVFLSPALWPNNYFWLGHSSAIHACWESGREGEKFLDNPKCHLTTDMVCVCVCVWSWNMFLTIFDDLKNVFLSFLGYLNDLFLLAMVKLLPIAVVWIFFETPFLSPIMISMQANQRERTSWLLYFLSFVDPARPSWPTQLAKTMGISASVLTIIQSHHQHDNPS